MHTQFDASPFLSINWTHNSRSDFEYNPDNFAQQISKIHAAAASVCLTWGEISAHHSGSLSAQGGRGGGGSATSSLGGRPKGRSEHDSNTHFGLSSSTSGSNREYLKAIPLKMRSASYRWEARTNCGAAAMLSLVISSFTGLAVARF